jgi:N-acetylated-alpha-linked acidic dipeptidase
MHLGFTRSSVVAVLLSCLAGTPVLLRAQDAAPGYDAAGAAAERALEATVAGRVSASDAETHSTTLAREPHMAGTDAQARTRDYVIAQMKQWGLETSVHAYDVYMPHPLSVRAWRLSPDAIELPMVEGPVTGDPTSSGFPQIPPFNGYGAAGDASGEVVYVNYGLIEDYAHLDSLGISVAGKIAVARYGHSFRGIKAREAEKHGAVALFIYSDPADDGYLRGDVFPAGPMRPEQGVQRGSVMNDDGDPSTPGYPSLPGVPRLTPSQMAIPRIPVVPISYGNAAQLLRGLADPGAPCTPAKCLARDPELPASWQGGLPFRYHLGPGPVRARIQVSTDTGKAAYHTIWDTFGVVKGSTYPDQLVIIGGHRDAWGPGAADNVSGVTSVMEAARAIAAEAKAGRRPKRTIVFATWDAEEWGLIGSTEYVEEDSLRLARDAIAYLNQDVAADGPAFGATGSPSLRASVRDIARHTLDPDDTTITVFQAWRRSPRAGGGATMGAPDTVPAFGDPGGGSDFAGFYNHLGIPIIEWGFGGPGGVYHSAYDDNTWMSRFGDPGFVRHAGAARIGVALLLRLANADILPYDYVEYARTMRGYVPALDKEASARGMSVSMTALTAAIARLDTAARVFGAVRDSVLATPKHKSVAAANTALLGVERALTRPAGLRTRPWFRNLIYAADEDNGYAEVTFPSVAEAIRSGDRALVEREVADLADRFDAATRALSAATAALR